ncbi:translation initiation factor IF-2-like [Bubalus bubalis]|uniref:translation initiation factor IF-2-like n=1 Tax=Bubalus bubalis TaxID=89462 RepID=UPI000DBC5200|nr:translation initiation factor IF-2-like [Bubalus bubalis]
MRSAAKGAGRTGHAAPSPDPARAGGRGRPRGGPAGGRPAGSSPRRPASIKPSARQPARPGTRGGGGARTPLPPGSRVPEGERDPLETRGGPGPGRGRTPHPPRHGGRAAGTPSRNEALPGAFKSSKPHPIWKNLRCLPSVFEDTSLGPSQFKGLPMEANAFPSSFSPHPHLLGL